MLNRRDRSSASKLSKVSIEIMKILSDGEWHSTTSLVMAVGAYIRPEIAMRRALSKYKSTNIDQGRAEIVTRRMRKWRYSNKIETRHNNNHTEWRLKDKEYADSVLGLPPSPVSMLVPKLTTPHTIDEDWVRRIVRDEVDKFRLVLNFVRVHEKRRKLYAKRND